MSADTSIPWCEWQVILMTLVINHSLDNDSVVCTIFWPVLCCEIGLNNLWSRKQIQPLCWWRQEPILRGGKYLRVPIPGSDPIYEGLSSVLIYTQMKHLENRKRGVEKLHFVAHFCFENEAGMLASEHAFVAPAWIKLCINKIALWR